MSNYCVRIRTNLYFIHNHIFVSNIENFPKLLNNDQYSRLTYVFEADW